MNTYKMGLKSYYLLLESLEQIPSLGKKSAQKIALSLSMENKFLALKLAHALEESAHNVRLCQKCFALSEGEICEICLDSERANGELCIVAHQKDIFTLEAMNEFSGRYFVLNSHLEMKDIDFSILKKRVVEECIEEVIFALSPTLANEAVMLFVEDKLEDLPCKLKFSKIAQGVPTGIGLDSIDQLSLSRAFFSRVKV
ncbi:recombination mediator RecR [Helicobacter himalayensis]|uniref:recombination mediator RecR n=1 Tax=Helicobacter himalayensis TaxID=1591088 RepID=UPI000829EDEC|nr:recombination mediator RecR [Helicobacter himalayensis]